MAADLADLPSSSTSDAVEAVNNEAESEEGEGVNEVVDGVHEVSLDDTATATSKKRKKKKSKAKTKAAAATAASIGVAADAGRIKISRNKHTKFISSYHGPWLQLPQEILESLYHLNCDPLARSAAQEAGSRKQREHAINCRNCVALEAKQLAAHPHLDGEPLDEHTHSHIMPPPIDPAAFNNVLEIRRLIDAASDLAVRAATGLSAAAMGALAASSNQPNGSVSAALGLDQTVNGRPAAMSGTRQGRLRSMAVAKLAQAYLIDEIAASVAVMQGATALDDLADKVLRQDASNPDAILVGFYHRKIPSAPVLARSFTHDELPTTLIHLVQRNPDKLAYYRTLAIWQTFEQDFAGSVATLTAALDYGRMLRKAYHQMKRESDKGASRGKKRGKNKMTSEGRNKTPETDSIDSSDNNFFAQRNPNLFLSSSNPGSLACEDAAGLAKVPGDDVNRQLYFFRGMANLHEACRRIEDGMFAIEMIERPSCGLTGENGDLTLEALGVSVKMDDFQTLRGCLLHSATPAKLQQYKDRFSLHNNAAKQGNDIFTLINSAKDDFLTFLSYFDVWESNGHAPGRDGLFADVKNQHLIDTGSSKNMPFRGRRIVHYRALTGRTLHSDPKTADGMAPQKPLLTTYHPLSAEAHFSLLLCLLLLGDFTALLRQHYRVARLMECIEGYPLFTPARTLNQSTYVEMMEMLAQGWLHGREAAGHSAMSNVTSEDSIHTAGNLDCLQHLSSYFTSAHGDFLDHSAEQAENDAAAAAAAALQDGKQRNGSERRALEQAAASAESRENDKKGSKRLTIKAAAEPPAASGSARAEATMAWLQVSALMRLEEEEAASARLPVTGSSNGIRTKSVSKGKQRQRDSANWERDGLEAGSSSQISEINGVLRPHVYTNGHHYNYPQPRLLE